MSGLSMRQFSRPIMRVVARLDACETARQLREKGGILARVSWRRTTTSPSAPTLCTWNTDFAISRPIVVTFSMATLFQLHPAILPQVGWRAVHSISCGLAACCTDLPRAAVRGGRHRRAKQAEHPKRSAGVAGRRGGPGRAPSTSRSAGRHQRNPPANAASADAPAGVIAWPRRQGSAARCGKAAMRRSTRSHQREAPDRQGRN